MKESQTELIRFFSEKDKSKARTDAYLPTWGLHQSRLAGIHKRQSTNESRHKANCFHPIEIEVTNERGVASMSGLVAHIKESQDRRSGAQRKPKPPGIGWPPGASVGSNGIRAKGIGHENRSQQLGNGHSQITESSVHAEFISLLFLGVVKGNVAHRGSKGSSSGTAEKRAEKEKVEGTVGIHECNSGDNHGNTKKDACRVYDIPSSSNLSKEGVGNAQGSARET